MRCRGYLFTDLHRFSVSGTANDVFQGSNGRAAGLRDYEEHMYVNTQSFDGFNVDKEPYMIPEDSPKKDLFDMSR